MRNTKVGPWSWERRVPKYFRVFSARFFFFCVKKFARSLMVLWNFMEFCDSLMFARSQMVKKSVFFFSTFHTMKQITGKQKVLVFKNILLNHVCKLYKKQQPESFNVKNKTMQFLSVLQIVLLVRFVWRDHVHIVRI